MSQIQGMVPDMSCRSTACGILFEANLPKFTSSDHPTTNLARSVISNVHDLGNVMHARVHTDFLPSRAADVVGQGLIFFMRLKVETVRA